jgi:hypothetical protein
MRSETKMEHFFGAMSTHNKPISDFLLMPVLLQARENVHQSMIVQLNTATAVCLTFCWNSEYRHPDFSRHS